MKESKSYWDWLEPLSEANVIPGMAASSLPPTGYNTPENNSDKKLGEKADKEMLCLHDWKLCVPWHMQKC